MSEGNGLDGVEISTATHTIEMTMRARVVMGADGNPVSTTLVGDHGVEMKWPGFAYPFVRNGAAVLVVTTVVQVARAEPKLAPKIILPGNK